MCRARLNLRSVEFFYFRHLRSTCQLIIVHCRDATQSAALLRLTWNVNVMHPMHLTRQRAMSDIAKSEERAQRFLDDPAIGNPRDYVRPSFCRKSRSYDFHPIEFLCQRKERGKSEENSNEILEIPSKQAPVERNEIRKQNCKQLLSDRIRAVRSNSTKDSIFLNW